MGGMEAQLRQPRFQHLLNIIYNISVMKLTMLPLVLLLVECVAAASVQFAIALGPCPGGKGAFQACDETIHACMCGSASDTDRQWCCGPKQPECYSWGQDCTGAQGLAGQGQIYCTGYSNKWCCNSEYEICTTLEGQSNICLTNFQNPYHDVSPDTASSLKAAFLSSSRTSSTVSSATTTSRTSTSISQTISTQTSSSSSEQSAQVQPASTKSPAPAHSSSLSGGAIAGIVIGVVAVLAMVGLGGFFFGRRRHHGGEDGPDEREDIPVDTSHPKAELSGVPMRAELPVGKLER